MAEPSHERLDEQDLSEGWLEQFRRWHGHAAAAGLSEPDAMVLATADGDGRPSARSVLLRGLDERGFVFYTNLDSRKGREIAANPHAALVFPWFQIHRQVIAAGEVEAVEAAQADAYFATRPYGSRIGAHASHQSQVIADRSVLERAWAAAQGRYPEDRAVPRPDRWGGLRLRPEWVEFWQGRRDRLHDRLRYRASADGWVIERLSP